MPIFELIVDMWSNLLVIHPCSPISDENDKHVLLHPTSEPLGRLPCLSKHDIHRTFLGDISLVDYTKSIVRQPFTLGKPSDCVQCVVSAITCQNSGEVFSTS